MQEIIELVTNNGLSLAISIVVLYGAIQLMNIYINSLKEKFASKKEKSIFDYKHRINEHINKLIEKTALRTNADRVAVFEFHNGDKNISGMPFLKLTNTYEVSNGKVKSNKVELTNIPCSLFTNIVKMIREDEFLLVDMEDARKELNEFAYELLRKENVSKALYTKIVDKDDLFAGFVGLYRAESQYVMRKGDYIELKDLALEIGTLFSLRKRKH